MPQAPRDLELLLARSVDPEELAVLTGLKPAMRVSAGESELKTVTDRARRAGLSVVTAVGSPRTFRTGTPVYIVYISPEMDIARRLRDVESGVEDLPSHAGQRAAHAEIGRLLGYPACCIEAFLVRRAREETTAKLGDGPEDFSAARAALAASSGDPDPLLNVLLLDYGVRLVTYYPCSFTCAPSGAFARALLERVAKKSRAAASALASRAMRSLVLARSGARVAVDISPDGHLSKAEALVRARGGLAPLDRALASSLNETAAGTAGVGWSAVVASRTEPSDAVAEAAGGFSLLFLDFAAARRRISVPSGNSPLQA